MLIGLLMNPHYNSLNRTIVGLKVLDILVLLLSLFQFESNYSRIERQELQILCHQLTVSLNRTIVGLKERIDYWIEYLERWFESNYSRIERCCLFISLLYSSKFESNYSRIESMLRRLRRRPRQCLFESNYSRIESGQGLSLWQTCSYLYTFESNYSRIERLHDIYD